MFGYFTTKLESNIWCLCYSNIDTFVIKWSQSEFTGKLFVENRRLYESKVRKLVEESILVDQITNDLKLTDDQSQSNEKASNEWSKATATITTTITTTTTTKL